MITEHPYRESSFVEYELPKLHRIMKTDSGAILAILETEHGFADVRGIKPWFKRKWFFQATNVLVPKKYWPAIERIILAWKAEEEAKRHAPWRKTLSRIDV